MVFAFFAGNISALVRCSTAYNETELMNLAGQYKKTIMDFYPRGTIYDRNGIRLTNRQDEGYRFIDAPSCARAPVASTVLGSVTEYESSEGGGSIALGSSGIQRAYDSLLNGGSKITVLAPVDAKGNILSKNGIQVASDHINEGCIINLTLDYALQREFEEAMKQYAGEIECSGISVILSEAKSGRILVMASYGDEMNKTVLSYQPGSIMKIVAAAAMLESDDIDLNEEYECTASVTANNSQHYCSGRTAHGAIGLSEAFAQSCNCYFYEAAKKIEYISEDGITRSPIADMARRWGFSEFGEPSADFELSYSSHYSFVSSIVYNDEDLFNTTLGQGRTQASTYLINKIVAAIASGGTAISPYLVESIIDPAGNSVEIAPKENFSLGLAEQSVEKLQEMMRLAATSGTASLNSLAKHGGLSGKTGTAQNAASSDHAWLTGYFPYKHPQYAMTVLIEEGGSSSNAVTLYNRLCDLLFEIYPQGE